jgi:hypothetical protein
VAAPGRRYTAENVCPFPSNVNNINILDVQNGGWARHGLGRQVVGERRVAWLAGDKPDRDGKGASKALDLPERQESNSLL